MVSTKQLRHRFIVNVSRSCSAAMLILQLKANGSYALDRRPNCPKSSARKHNRSLRGLVAVPFTSESIEVSNFLYYKRRFLAHAASNTNSYIIAEVESSEDGTYRLGTNMLTIADCNRQIELEFSFETRGARRRSLAQAELLADLINGFRDSLREEAIQIEQVSKKRRRPTK